MHTNCVCCVRSWLFITSNMSSGYGSSQDLNPLRVKFLTTVGKQQKIFFKHFILYSISTVIHSKIDILAVS